jgi:hypothetical protein
LNYPLVAFPALALAVVIYAVAALFGGDGFRESLSDGVLALRMPAGVEWRLTAGDLFVMVGIVALFMDLLKSTSTSSAAVVNHVLSTALFVLCLVLFVLVPAFVTTPFFMIMIMALLDIVAGFTITTISARRDVAFD